MALPSKSSIRAWLSPEFFKWRRSAEGLGYLDDAAWKRAYEHHRHAEDVLRNRTDYMSRVDAISTLKRCLSQRLQHLQSVYAFDKIPLPNWPKRVLDQMAELQMVRPFLLKHLMEIRNRIEHEDALPPGPGRCKEILDILWYFLRSTDPFAKVQYDAFYFVKPKTSADEASVRFEVHPDRSWCVDIQGWLGPNWISTRNHPARIQIDCAKFERVENHSHLKPGTIVFNGTVLGPSEAIAGIIKQYFELW